MNDFPWLIFKIDHELYAINSENLSAISNLEGSMITAMPNASAAIRGIVNFRGSTIPLVDLRRLYELESQEDEYANFKAMIAQRRADHVNWVNELERVMKTGEEFKLATDPHQCAFGKWYDQFESDLANVNFTLRKVEAPHKSLHELAQKVMDCRNHTDPDAFNSCVNLNIKEARENYMKQVLTILDEVEEVFRHCYKELMIVIEDEGNAYGLIVDEVVSVEPISPAADEGMIGYFHKNSVRGVGRRNSGDQLILLIDEKKLKQTVENELKMV